jgi:hypothetical protein
MELGGSFTIPPEQESMLLDSMMNLRLLLQSDSSKDLGLHAQRQIQQHQQQLQLQQLREQMAAAGEQQAQQGQGQQPGQQVVPGAIGALLSQASDATLARMRSEDLGNMLLDDLRTEGSFSYRWAPGAGAGAGAGLGLGLGPGGAQGRRSWVRELRHVPPGRGARPHTRPPRAPAAGSSSSSAASRSCTWSGCTARRSGSCSRSTRRSCAI